MDYDFAVIGGGSAGYAAARTAVDKGLKTVLIEGGEKIGGLCILRGCMPSKALIESANRMLTLRRAQEFGLRASGLEVHAAEIIARQHRFVEEFADHRRGQIEYGAFDFLRGLAEFTGPHSLVIRWPGAEDRTITARSFIVATGSVIQTPPIPGLAESGALTSDGALELAALPASLAVLGAGPVALEMAHYFSALGVAVTVIQRGPQLLTGSDPDLAKALERALRKRGIAIHTDTRITAIERLSDELRRVHFEQDGESRTVECAQILNALGRRPNLDRLGLATAGVTLAKGRLEMNAHQQTNQPHIFAGGDCCGPHEVVHIGLQQGEIAARNAARLLAERGEPLESIDYRLNLYAVFTEPQVATVGLNEADAKARGPIRIATYPFDDHGKSLVMGETEGFVKLITDAATGEILGGSVVGPHASDLIHEIVVAMHFHSTAAQLATVPHYHPTLSEIWTYPAEELAAPE